MKHLIGSIATVIQPPTIVVEHAGWALQSMIRSGGPLRQVHSVRFGYDLNNTI